MIEIKLSVIALVLLVFSGLAMIGLIGYVISNLLNYPNISSPFKVLVDYSKILGGIRVGCV